MLACRKIVYETLCVITIFRFGASSHCLRLNKIPILYTLSVPCVPLWLMFVFFLLCSCFGRLKYTTKSLLPSSGCALCKWGQETLYSFAAASDVYSELPYITFSYLFPLLLYIHIIFFLSWFLLLFFCFFSSLASHLSFLACIPFRLIENHRASFLVIFLLLKLHTHTQIYTRYIRTSG